MVKMKLGELIDVNEKCNDATKFIGELTRAVEQNFGKTVEFFGNNMSISDIRHNLQHLQDVVTQMKIIAIDLIDRVEVTI